MTENQTRIRELKHAEFGKVRVVDIGGELWFAAADVCKTLEIKKSHMRRLRDSEKQLYPMPALVGVQKMTITSAIGLNLLMSLSHNLEAKNWLAEAVLSEKKIEFALCESSSINYDPDSLQAKKGSLGEAIVKKNIKLLAKNCEIKRPEDTFKSGASVVDFVVNFGDERNSCFVEVKTQAAYPFGVEQAPCYSFPKSRIEAYKEYGKRHGKRIKIYIVDPADGFIYFDDLLDLEKPCDIDARHFPFDRWVEKLGGYFHYWHRNQFKYNFVVAAKDLAALRKLFDYT